ncbi:MAG: lipoprotein-releasing ABC transporter permease subunit [Deltaproteobacteria bacterium]|nr:lipoprotein-releasing ABC transporter permease subunit [Deltaproteobacteria bacterium]
MSELLEVLQRAGGGLALSFIVVLMIGIGTLALLFFGSAVIVLDRFARGPRRMRTVLWAALGWAALLGVLATDREGAPGIAIEIALGAWPGGLQAWALGALVALVFTAAAQALTALLLRAAAPRLLGAAALLAAGAGYVLLAAGLGHLGYSSAPALVAGLCWAGLRLRRRRSQRAGHPVSASAAAKAGAGDAERLAGLLALLLTLGAALPLLPAAASLGALGAALLSCVVGLVVLGLLPLAAAGFLSSRGSAEWFIAGRYLFAKRRQTFISLITGICVAGVAAGVWLIVTVLSVMNGFENTWREEIIGNRAHLTVHHAQGAISDWRALLEQIEALPDVSGAAPYLDADGMVRGAGGIAGVRLHGIDPERVVRVTDLQADLLPGSEGALKALAPGAQGLPGLVIGSRLAQRSGARRGDSLALISPFGGPPTPLGPAPRLKLFRVAGIFETSFFQYDEVYVFTDLAAARNFKGVGDSVDGIEVRTRDHYRSRRAGRQIEAALGESYYTRDWKDFFPAFFQALKTERVMMFVLLTMIMVVAAFAIVVTLVMMIMEKSGDIAILKAMGAGDSAIERIFAIEGAMIGLLGTLAGAAAGIAVTTQLGWVQAQVELLTGVDTLPAEIYQFRTLPWEIDVGQVAVVIALAMVLALGATLLPSRHGARLDPAEALRHE